MPRAPFNAFTFPYRKQGDQIEYALLKRSDCGVWHGASGGGEEGETPIEAARRESFEEAGIPEGTDFMQLDSTSYIPAVGFRDCELWPDDVYVIPQYYFGACIDTPDLVLSREHNEFMWKGYEEAHALLFFHTDKNALWELNQRLKGKGPRVVEDTYRLFELG